jgi:hypothetical protein
MKLVFLYGLPATGKLTVGRRLAAITGFKLFHNHLAVDLLTSVFDFGTPAFVKLREEIWLSVFDEARNSGIHGLIFTFAPERTVTADFVRKAEQAGGVCFVELFCSEETLKARVGDPSRLAHGKLNSAQKFDELKSNGVFDVSYMPEPQLRVDTGACSADEAARQIARSIGVSFQTPSQPERP